MEKTLSIIVPTYNMEKYLRKCLDSLIVSDENMPRLEVLVINDGSKDTSSQIAHEYEARYSQTFRVIDKENGNYGSCINRGLKEAIGKYVKVLDADDYFDSDVLNDYISYLTNVDTEMVLTDYVQVDENYRVTKRYKFNLPVDICVPVLSLCSSEIVFRLAHQDITYNTSLLHKLNYKQTEGISYTDNEWVFMPMSSVSTIRYYPHILYYYLRGREGQTFDPKVLRKSYNQREIVMRSLIQYYQNVSCDCNSENYIFIKQRLIKRLSGFYKFHLLISGSYDSNNTLENFDKYLSIQASDIYKCLNDTSAKFSFRFIKTWRDAGYDIQIFPLRFYRMIKKMF